MKKEEVDYLLLLVRGVLENMPQPGTVWIGIEAEHGITHMPMMIAPERGAQSIVIECKSYGEVRNLSYSTSGRVRP